MVLSRGGAPQSPRSKAGAKWLSKIRKGQVAPKGLHLSQLKSFQHNKSEEKLKKVFLLLMSFNFINFIFHKKFRFSDDLFTHISSWCSLDMCVNFTYIIKIIILSIIQSLLNPHNGFYII